MAENISHKIILDDKDTFLPNYLKATNHTENIFEFLNNSDKAIEVFYSSIPQEKINYAYAKGKWSITEILQHITDSERVMGMRALSFARGDKNHFPGFDQDIYHTNSSSKLDFREKIEELVVLRKSHILMFQSFDEKQLNSSGVSSGFLRSVKAHAYIIVGHELHHRKTIAERYLNL